LHLPASPADLHLSRQGTWNDDHTPADLRFRRRDGAQRARAERAIAGMATRRVRGGIAGKGRLIAAIMAIFLVVASSVVWRRTKGMAEARTLQTLASTRAELDSRRLQLESDIVSQASRSRLGVRVQSQLGLQVPNDSQVILLARPASPSRRGR